MLDRNIRLVIAYDGTEFHGWQRQAGTRTVQGVLDDAVSDMVCADIRLAGASRTDAGVHARGQIANFHTNSDIDTSRLCRGVNSRLPADVAVLRVEEVDVMFISRHAAGKHYQYRIWRGEMDDPIGRRTHWHCRYLLDIDAMRRALPLMTGSLDFKGLIVNPGKKYDTTVRTVTSLSLVEQGPEVIVDVFGKSFMYKQVRSIVGVLVAVGRGRMRVEDVPALISGALPVRRAEVLPPQGLTLMEVFYNAV